MLEGKLAGKVFSVVNMKGGVGKTSTVIGLSETLATNTSDAVLVIDVDTQANASYCLAGDTVLKELVSEDKTIDEFFYRRLVGGDNCTIEPYIRGQVSHLSHRNRQLNISLLASSPYLRVTEREIIYELTKKHLSMQAIEGRTVSILSPIIQQLRQQYTYIIFDCAPGISAFTTAAMLTSDFVIIPTIPDFLSTLGLVAFCASILKEAQFKKPSLSAHVLIARKNNTNHHKEYHDVVREKANLSTSTFCLLNTVIPESVQIPQALNMINYEHPTYTRKYTQQLAGIFSELAKEIRGIK
jgi:chromosome partitioning protein